MIRNTKHALSIFKKEKTLKGITKERQRRNKERRKGEGRKRRGFEGSWLLRRHPERWLKAGCKWPKPQFGFPRLPHLINCKQVVKGLSKADSSGFWKHTWKPSDPERRGGLGWKPFSPWHSKGNQCRLEVLANGLVESKKDILLKGRVSVTVELVYYKSWYFDDMFLLMGEANIFLSYVFSAFKKRHIS